MDTTIIAALIGVIGGLIGVWIGGRISRQASAESVGTANKNAIALMQRQEFFIAASKFKATVLFELLGLYPVNQFWDENNFPRIYKSIPAIMSAAAEFRFFVKSKADFDTAIKNYDEYCRKTTYDDITVDTMWPEMCKDGKIGKREQFKDIVDHLILFANEE